MRTDPPSADLPDMITGELRTLNTQLPKTRKSLRTLMREAHPHVVLGDGNRHYFRKKELESLACMLYEHEQDSLMLPIIMEVHSDGTGVTVRTARGIEEKILSTILDMPVTTVEGRITLFRPQVSVIRIKMPTTTQYMFC